jgi:hypothetical protein
MWNKTVDVLASYTDFSITACHVESIRLQFSALSLLGEELLQTECLVVYYVTQAAKVGHPVAKEAAATIRTLVQAASVTLLFSCANFLRLLVQGVKYSFP